MFIYIWFGYEIGFLAALESLECFSSCLENGSDADTNRSSFLLFKGWILGFLAFLALISGANCFTHLLDAMAEGGGE
jgi:hypothetical protein